MYIERKMADSLKQRAKGFPVVTISGPRQSGKTTFARQHFKDYTYVSLESFDNRDHATQDPRDFIRKYPSKTIIDEFQRAPELASYLQEHIDTVNKPGMYVLTGSNQFEYLHSVSQSLTGRTIMLKLLPFSFEELYASQMKTPELDNIIVKGWYPRIFDQEIDHVEFYRSYFETYIQRDVRDIIQIRNLNDFRRFTQLCAGRTGQIVNFSTIANEIGVSYHTIKAWLSILQASYIVELLQPFYRNYNKRIIKSAKLYFLDTGLACNLIGITNSRQLSTHPLRGELFETYVFSELLKRKYNYKATSNIYYFRDSNNNEIDFLVENGHGLLPIEAKLNATPRKMHFKNLDFFHSLSDNVYKKCLIYSGIDSFNRFNTDIISFKDISKINL
jgi:predicted AAA+ superfamily ATPase